MNVLGIVDAAAKLSFLPGIINTNLKTKEKTILQLLSSDKIKSLLHRQLSSDHCILSIESVGEDEGYYGEQTLVLKPAYLEAVEPSVCCGFERLHYDLGENLWLMLWSIDENLRMQEGAV